MWTLMSISNMLTNSETLTMLCWGNSANSNVASKFSLRASSICTTACKIAGMYSTSWVKWVIVYCRNFQWVLFMHKIIYFISRQLPLAIKFVILFLHGFPLLLFSLGSLRRLVFPKRASRFSSGVMIALVGIILFFFFIGQFQYFRVLVVKLSSSHFAVFSFTTIRRFVVWVREVRISLSF